MSSTATAASAHVYATRVLPKQQPAAAYEPLVSLVTGQRADSFLLDEPIDYPAETRAILQAPRVEEDGLFVGGPFGA